jgi:hypothetical protein
MQIGIGEWKTWNGFKATVACCRPNAEYPWVGWLGHDGPLIAWNDKGQVKLDTPHVHNLEAPWTWTPTATGHNPDNLTEEQVGVKDGWRLLDLDEIKSRKQRVAEAWNPALLMWYPEYNGSSRNITYRTKFSRSELAALDKLKKRLIRVEELPAVCWVMEGSSMSNQYLLSYRNNSSNHIGIGGELAHHLSYYKDKNFQWSSDLITWNSFEVEDK